MRQGCRCLTRPFSSRPPNLSRSDIVIARSVFGWLTTGNSLVLYRFVLVVVPYSALIVAPSDGSDGGIDVEDGDWLT